MNDPMVTILNGPHLCLRPPQESDKTDRLACGRDPEFRRMVGGHPNVCPPLTLVLGYAFDVLHLHRVDLRMLAFNERAIACYEKCGFVKEGIEREGVFVGGEWQSDALMSILEQEYRLLPHC